MLGLPDTRQEIMAGQIVYAYVVVAQLRDDSNMHLLRVDIDTATPSVDDEDE